jgi:Holliday junction resolvasome RuvABC DNA-binding subunit
MLRGAAMPLPAEARPEALTPVEEDALSALINLGCNRAAAETALKRAKASGLPQEFEPLFRRALELVR